MRIEDCYVEQNHPIAKDYITNFSFVQSLFDFNPWMEDVWKQRILFLDERKGPRADRRQLIQALYVFNRKVENAPEAFTSIRLLEEDGTLVVIGGHQACLLTGPLLVIYKAMTIVQTARRASTKLQRPVIPVFWIAGEDHDFDEVNHIYCLTKDLSIKKIKLEHPTGKRTSISRLTISPSQWAELLDQLHQLLIETEFKQGIMDKLNYIKDRSQTLVEFFARVMSWLFGSYGLVLIDSDDPNIRQLEGEMFERLITHYDEINDALLIGKREVESLGYSPQLEIEKYNSNLFIFHERERIRLQVDEFGNFTDKSGNIRFSMKELIQVARNDSSRLSTNVVTRPLMQEFLFPILGVILGPAEIAYWGLLRNAFHVFDMKMPVIIPRLQFTIIENHIFNYMQRYGILFEDVFSNFGHKKRAWIEERDTLKLKEHFDRIKQNFVDMYTPIIELVSNINPGMRDLGEENMKRILKNITFLENKSISAYEAQFDTAIRRFERIRQNILPMGRPQERVYNIFAYLNKYGERWLSELIETPVANNSIHKIIYF